jgi:hypothetical protein
VVTFEGRYRKPLEPLLLLNLVWILARHRAAHPQNDETLDELSTKHAVQGNVTDAIQN